MFTLEVEDNFAAAHQLRAYHGKCENLHGHNWRVKIAVSGDNLLDAGMLIDFGDLKKILAEILNQFDHSLLNAAPPFDTINPTSELLAKFIFTQVAAKIPANTRVAAVTVWESEKCSATYRQ